MTPLNFGLRCTHFLFRTIDNSTIIYENLKLRESTHKQNTGGSCTSIRLLGNNLGRLDIVDIPHGGKLRIGAWVVFSIDSNLLPLVLTLTFPKCGLKHLKTVALDIFVGREASVEGLCLWA